MIEEDALRRQWAESRTKFQLPVRDGMDRDEA